MRYYEIATVINGMLTDEQIESTDKWVQELIVREGGEVLKVEKWGRRRMAYFIKKTRQGFYIFYGVKSPVTLPKIIEKEFRVSESIIRFLILASDEEAVKKEALVDVPPSDDNYTLGFDLESDDLDDDYTTRSKSKYVEPDSDEDLIDERKVEDTDIPIPDIPIEEPPSEEKQEPDDLF
jgi:small subunit ribosomal protein S6